MTRAWKAAPGNRPRSPVATAMASCMFSNTCLPIWSSTVPNCSLLACISGTTGVFRLRESGNKMMIIRRIFPNCYLLVCISVKNEILLFVWLFVVYVTIIQSEHINFVFVCMPGICIYVLMV